MESSPWEVWFQLRHDVGIQNTAAGLLVNYVPCDWRSVSLDSWAPPCEARFLTPHPSVLWRTPADLQLVSLPLIFIPPQSLFHTTVRKTFLKHKSNMSILCLEPSIMISQIPLKSINGVLALNKRVIEHLIKQDVLELVTHALF